jgi:hypothetical protein
VGAGGEKEINAEDAENAEEEEPGLSRPAVGRRSDVAGNINRGMRNPMNSAA